MSIRLRTTLVIAASLGLAACYNDGYGYGGLSVGYSSAYPSYYGWNDGFYYPGAGYYVYDRGGHRQRWNDSQRSYWTDRQNSRHGVGGGEPRENWQAFRQDRQAARSGDLAREQYRMNRQADRQAWRQESRRENRRNRRD